MNKKISIGIVCVSLVLIASHATPLCTSITMIKPIILKISTDRFVKTITAEGQTYTINMTTKSFLWSNRVLVLQGNATARVGPGILHVNVTRVIKPKFEQPLKTMSVLPKQSIWGLLFITVATKLAVLDIHILTITIRTGLIYGITHGPKQEIINIRVIDTYISPSIN